jgi:hypothetical protein
MSTDLSAYPAIWSSLFVRIDVEDYQVLRFSDFYRPYTINSESYAALGSLMDVSSTESQMRLSEQELTITLSGIPTTNIDSVLDYKIKGSPVEIYRGLFDPNTGADITAPVGKFVGLVNNFALQEDWDNETRSSTVTIILTCSSLIGVLNTKLAGRFSNPTDQQKFYPGDNSMNRVPSLINSNFNFGAPA